MNLIKDAVEILGEIGRRITNPNILIAKVLNSVSLVSVATQKKFTFRWMETWTVAL